MPAAAGKTSTLVEAILQVPILPPRMVALPVPSGAFGESQGPWSVLRVDSAFPGTRVQFLFDRLVVPSLKRDGRINVFDLATKLPFSFVI